MRVSSVRELSPRWRSRIFYCLLPGQTMSFLPMDCLASGRLAGHVSDGTALNSSPILKNWQWWSRWPTGAALAQDGDAKA